MIPQALASMAVGQLGGDYYADTSAHTGTWGMIQCITDCAFTTLTANTGFPSGTLTGITLKAGMVIFGQYTAITLSSGSVIAYKYKAA